MSASNGLYDRNARTELRIYQPNVGKHPNTRHARFAGKPVTVTWMPPAFSPTGETTRSGPIHLIKWFGFVKELNKQVPEDELLPLPTVDKETP